MLSIEQKIEMEKILNDMDDYREDVREFKEQFVGKKEYDFEDYREKKEVNYIFEEEVLGKCEDCELFFENGKFCKKCRR